MFWFEAEHPETGETLEVRALVCGATRGARDLYGVPLEPDDLPEMVICEVWGEAGKGVSFAGFEDALVDVGWRKLKDG
jgi:hypothetical protein